MAIGNGSLGFRDISGVSGLDSIRDARSGAAWVDFDNDGDLDIVRRPGTFVPGKPGVLLFENHLADTAGWIRIDLRGTTSGTEAWGATVRVQTETGTQTQIVSGGSGHASQSDRRLLFGLGDQEYTGPISVTWPSGVIQQFQGVPTRTSLRVTEGSATPQFLVERRARAPEVAALHGLNVKVGAPLPDVAIDRASIRSLLPDGGVIAVWADWCSRCRSEIPDLNRKFASGESVLGLSFDTSVRAKVVALSMEYPTVWAPKDEVDKIFTSGVQVLPLKIEIDANGIITDLEMKGR